MKLTDGQKDKVVEAAQRVVKARARYREGEFDITLDELEAALSLSPLPSDEELRETVRFVISNGQSSIEIHRAIYARALRDMQTHAKRLLDEPGWQLEDFEIELRNLTEEMESRK